MFSCWFAYGSHSCSAKSDLMKLACLCHTCIEKVSLILCSKPKGKGSSDLQPGIPHSWRAEQGAGSAAIQIRISSSVQHVYLPEKQAQIQACSLMPVMVDETSTIRQAFKLALGQRRIYFNLRRDRDTSHPRPTLTIWTIRFVLYWCRAQSEDRCRPLKYRYRDAVCLEID
jgi:hypothetical protein